MPSSNSSLLRNYLRRLASAPNASGSDREILARFAQEGDQDAFAVLVGRHGPSVLRVCQSVLGKSADAEDAFQATFVVLARKASSLTWQSSIASWLYGVANRVSMKLRSRARNAAPLEQIEEPESAVEAQAPLTIREAESLLHEELAALPEKYRAPVVLCYFQEKTQDEAAKDLGWSLRTLQRRLQKAREVLRLRLQKRGVTLSSALFASLFTATAGQAVSPLVLSATVRIATSVPSSPNPIITLADGVIQSMPKSHYKLVLIAGVILAASLITTSILLSGFSKPQLPAQPPAQNATTKQAPNVQAAGRLPLPPNAIRRFGDLLFRTNSLIEYAFLDDAKVLFVRGIFRDIRTGKIIRRWDLKPPHGEIAFSSDKKLVACSREDGLLDIWEFDKQVRLHALPTDTSGGVNIIHNIKFSRDNKTLAANVSPKHVQVWNVATGKLQATLRDDPYNVNFAMSTDGGKIATWQHKRFHWHRCKSLRIWNVAKQKTLATFHRPGGDIIDADVAPDGKTVAIVEENGAVQVVDVKGNLLHKYKGPKDAAKIAFSPDGKRLVIAAKTGKTQRLRSSDLSRIDDCQGPACEVRDIIFAKDGRTMIYGRDGGVICLWETSGRIISPRPGHHSSVIDVAFSPDGKKLISLGQNSASHGRGSHHGDAVRVWDVATGKQLRSLPALTDSLITELSPHGRYCAIGTQYTDFRNNGKCAVSITDIATGKQIGKIANQLQPLAFSADETILATASGNRTLCLWETATLRRLDVISLNDIYASAAALGAGARFVAYREADQLPVRSDDVKIWDRKLRKIVAVCKAPMGGRFSRIALSPDGKTLAAVTLGRGVATWRSRDGKFLGFLPGSEEHTKVGDNYVRLVFSKDGTMLATGRANLADVWDVARQKRIKRIEMPNDHTNHVNTLAISPDGHHLATGSSNTAILLWDLRGMD